jgi:hypothetical protein
MDNTKDIQKGDQISRFLDNKGVRTNPFGSNISGERAYQRAERLVVALHLLTNHVPTSEPSRGATRDAGIALLSFVLGLRDEMRSPQSSRFQSALSSIRELISLVRTLCISGFVSPHNAEIVVESLDELGNFLNASQRSTLSESIVLNKNDLVSGFDKASLSDIKDMSDVKDRKLSVSTHAAKQDLSYSSAELVRRESGIIEVLRSKGQLGIKDISSNLPEYSEKMIQRGLAQLTAQGKVKKVGSKRWSRYSIAG